MLLTFDFRLYSYEVTDLDPTSDLKRDLSMGLRDELKKHLTPNEEVLVSLPGSFGEALIVTDRRAIVIRERDTGASGVYDVFSYGFGKIKSAQAVPTGTGGYIEFDLGDATDPEQRRVYFPSYELSKFQSAVDYVKARLSEPAPVAAPTPSPEAAAPAVEGACPGCGSAVSKGDVFCAHCGRQLLAICFACNQSSPLDAEHCTNCGAELVDFHPECPRCAARIQNWMSFCPACGSALGARCAACGVRIVPDWKHCANCGRLIGSESLDASAARSLQRRLQNMREVESQPNQPVSTVPEPEPEAAPAGDTSAAKTHNARGQQHFENDELEEAVKEFETAVLLEPNNPTYHCNLAVALDEADMDDEALVEYEKTLELDPDDLTALLSLGYMYNENSEPEKAQRVWSRILVLSPDSAEAQEVRDNLRHQEQL